MYFSRFLNVSATNTDALLTPLKLSSKGGGKVFLGDIPGSALPHGLEALLGQGFPASCLLMGSGTRRILPERGPVNREGVQSV